MSTQPHSQPSTGRSSKSSKCTRPTGFCLRVFRKATTLPLFASILFALGSGVQTLAQTAWTPVWQDDFNGPAGAAPDPSKWTFDLGNNFGNGEIDTGTNTRANSYQDGNGNLVIAVLYDPTTKTYTSAHLKTAGLYAAGAYGRIEARIQAPYAQGVGSAFWALGNDYVTGTPWPWAGELDIMEITSNTPGHNGSTIHGGETDSQNRYAYEGLSRTVDLPAGQQFNQAFHVFGVTWAPYHLTFDLDGVPYGETYLHNTGATDIWAMNQPIYLILSAGVGASNTGLPVNGQGYPAYLKADYVHVFKAAAGAPAAPGTLTATGTNSNATTLNWTGSTTPGVTYNIYAGTVANFTPGLDTLVAENVAGTSYTHNGIAANTTSYYKVVASNAGGESSPAIATVQTQPLGNSSGVNLSAGGYAIGNYMNSKYVLGGNTNYHPTNNVDTSLITNPAPAAVYQTERWGQAAWTVTDLTPGQIYGVRLHFVETTHTAAGQRAFNVSLNSQDVLTNFDIVQAAGAPNRAVAQQFYTRANEFGIIELQTNYGTSTVAGMDLNPTVSAIDITPAASNILSGATPGNLTKLSINSAGPAVGNFVADQDFNGGYAAPAVTNTIDVSAANAAPQAVYQTQRLVPFTYILTSLQAGASYNIRMHFAETYWTAAGKRIFNIALNGTKVLQNFDVFATAGANKAVVKDFPTRADRYGQVIVQLLYGGQDQPFISAIEALQTAAGVAAPSNLTATATGSSVNLAWTASSSTGVTYTVYRSSGNGALNAIASGLSGTAYTDTNNLVGGTAYQYQVVASTNATTQSPGSNTATVTFGSATGTGSGTLVAIDAGGPATGSFLGDTDFTGGGTASTGNLIATAGLSNPAPQTVYQSERAGTFTYTIPGFSKGSTHIVRLHFAEFYFSAPGQRIFNVSINNVPVLSNFDIVTAAGGPNKATIQQFTTTADANGQIVLQFTNGAKDQPKLSGLEIQ